MKNPQDFFQDFLNLHEGARSTNNIYRVLEAALRYYGAITQDNMWDTNSYNEMPAIETLLRDLRRVKKRNGWFDEKSQVRAEQERQEQSFQTIEEETVEVTQDLFPPHGVIPGIGSIDRKTVEKLTEDKLGPSEFERKMALARAEYNKVINK